MVKPNIAKILKKTKEEYDNICDQLIGSDEVGQLVRVHYRPTWTTSSTPQFNEWGNASLNATPIMSDGQTGQKQDEVTAEIRMRVYSTDPQGFGRANLRSFGGIQMVEGEILTIGLMTDYQKVANCSFADFYIATEDITGPKSYVLSSEIRPHGFGKDRYFFCFWNKKE